MPPTPCSRAPMAKPHRQPRSVKKWPTWWRVCAVNWHRSNRWSCWVKSTAPWVTTTRTWPLTPILTGPPMPNCSWKVARCAVGNYNAHLATFHEQFGIGGPVNIGVSGQVRVVVTHGAVDFTQQLYLFDLCQLPAQTRHHVGHFFTDRGWRGGLAMGAREHGVGGIVVAQFDQRVDNFPALGQHLLPSGLEHKGVGEVINVFTCAGEVHVFQYRFQFRVAGELLFQEVFHGFNVVVGGALNVFDFLRLGFAEVLDQVVELAMGLRTERRNFGNAVVLAQALQPAYLHRHAAVNQTKFAEHRAQ